MHHVEFFLSGKMPTTETLRGGSLNGLLSARRWKRTKKEWCEMSGFRAKVNCTVHWAFLKKPTRCLKFELVLAT